MLQRLALTFLPALALLLPVSAHATMFCVATGMQLQDAMVQAGNNGIADEIRITQGIKQHPGIGVPWGITSSHDLVISGGWNANCSLQTGGPASTILVGQTTTLAVRVADASPTIEVSNLSVHNGLGTMNFGAGLNVLVVGSSAPVVLIERVIARLNTHMDAPTGAAVKIILEGASATGQYTVRNSMFENNQGSGLDIALPFGATAYINNNTITANRVSQQARPAVVLHGAGLFFAANNIFAGNDTASDLWIGSTASSILRNNHVQKLAGTVGSNLNMTTGLAMLEQDAAGYWRPGNQSPVRDNGLANPAGGIGSKDIIGSSRVLGLGVDRGAVERSWNILFQDDFEL